MFSENLKSVIPGLGKRVGINVSVDNLISGHDIKARCDIAVCPYGSRKNARITKEHLIPDIAFKIESQEMGTAVFYRKSISSFLQDKRKLPVHCQV